MKKASLKEPFDRFFKKSAWYADFLNDIIERTAFKPYEKKEILEAFVLKIYVNWERLVEDIFIGCLNRNTSKYANHMGIKLPTHSTKAQCEVFLSGTGFFSVRKISDVKGLSRNILVSRYNPFTSIQKDDGGKIDEFYDIRNYLAHYSRLSKRRLKNIYKNYELTRLIEPGEFLFTNDTKTKQKRIFNYTRAVYNAAEVMSTFLCV